MWYGNAFDCRFNGNIMMSHFSKALIVPTALNKRRRTSASRWPWDHMHEQNKDIFLRIRTISVLVTHYVHIYGPFRDVYLIPFTRKDEKDRPIKCGQLSSFPYSKAA